MDGVAVTITTEGGTPVKTSIGAMKRVADQMTEMSARAAVDRKRPRTKADPDLDCAQDAAYGIAAGELRAFVERFERLDAEKKEIVDQQKGVMAEAKGRGYDVKVLRKIIALRRRDPQDVAEEEAVLEMYKAALGM